MDFVHLLIVNTSSGDTYHYAFMEYQDFDSLIEFITHNLPDEKDFTFELKELDILG